MTSFVVVSLSSFMHIADNLKIHAWLTHKNNISFHPLAKMILDGSYNDVCALNCCSS